MLNARSVAVKVLCDIERNNSYSNIAGDFAINEAGLERKDAALMSALVYGVLQRKITLDYVISKYLKSPISKIHPMVLSTLRMGAYQLLFMDKIPQSAAVNESVAIIKKSKQSFASGFANAVLRNISRGKTQILSDISNAEPYIRYSCPKEIYDEMTSFYGENDTLEFLKSSVETPSVYARVNSNKITPQSLFERFNSKNIEFYEKSPQGAFVLKNAGNVESMTEFKEGLFFIQDRASQLAIDAIDIKEDDKIIDVCSAPGGKSFTASMHLGKSGKVLSCDIYEKRVGLIKNGANRLGIDNLRAVVNDATVFNSEFGVFDVVLCDVPCSGLGVIRRKPEIKYRTLSSYDSLKDIQYSILDVSKKYVKQGGKLMYSTCTVRKVENEFIVKSFIENNPDFHILKEETLMPHTHDSDGFYYCLMERN